MTKQRWGVVYKATCAWCGLHNVSPVYVSTPQFCNRTCHQAYLDAKAPE